MEKSNAASQISVYSTTTI